MKNKIAVFIATWFYSGLIPFVMPGGMSGTYASLITLPFCYLALSIAETRTPFAYFAILLAIFLLGLLSVPRAEVALGPRIDWRGKIKKHDQNQIVIDEAFGMMVSCCPFILFKPQSILCGLILALFLFRLFDIVKPPPVYFFDRMKNAAGVMLDDFMAGIYAALVLFLLLLTAVL